MHLGTIDTGDDLLVAHTRGFHEHHAVGRQDDPGDEEEEPVQS